MTQPLQFKKSTSSNIDISDKGKIHKNVYDLIINSVVPLRMPKMPVSKPKGKHEYVWEIWNFHMHFAMQTSNNPEIKVPISLRVHLKRAA